MGNYNKVKYDFVHRTLNLINQYESIKEGFDSNEQYNHTLLINCLLGLIVLPKEKSISYLPNTRIELMKQLKNSGIVKSQFHQSIKDTVELIERLRNAVAHFDIDFISDTSENLIDKIQFKDSQANIIVATFYEDELLHFIKFYANLLLDNLSREK